MSVGSRLGTTSTQDYVLLGALAIAGYVAYQLVKGVKSVADPAIAAAKAAAQAGGQMTNQASEVFDTMQDPSAKTWASWYDPTQRSVYFYWLTFPDGNHHIVWGSDVLPDGSFMKDSIEYRIGTDKAGGLRAYAMPAGSTLASTDVGIRPDATGGWS